MERDEKNLALEEAKTRLKKVANKKMTLEEFDVWFYGNLSLEMQKYLNGPLSSKERDTPLMVARRDIETEKTRRRRRRGLPGTRKIRKTVTLLK